MADNSYVVHADYSIAKANRQLCSFEDLLS